MPWPGLRLPPVREQQVQRGLDEPVLTRAFSSHRDQRMSTLSARMRSKWTLKVTGGQ
ncbi:hypothetical protein [Saccharothrix sp.]|uniref:hypothetical protein n=1 Tax=Saccharothrix sp. TaxID=1873460 RepID=UPI0028116A4E|nr:hypothetical protein [Saccharothrix sp.]